MIFWLLIWLYKNINLQEKLCPWVSCDSTPCECIDKKTVYPKFQVTTWLFQRFTSIMKVWLSFSFDCFNSFFEFSSHVFYYFHRFYSVLETRKWTEQVHSNPRIFSLRQTNIDLLRKCFDYLIWRALGMMLTMFYSFLQKYRICYKFINFVYSLSLIFELLNDISHSEDLGFRIEKYTQHWLNRLPCTLGQLLKQKSIKEQKLFVLISWTTMGQNKRMVG